MRNFAPFAFVNDDVKSQIEASQSIIRTAESIANIIDRAPEELRFPIEMAARSLIATANALTANASHTSKHALQSILILEARSRAL